MKSKLWLSNLTSKSLAKIAYSLTLGVALGIMSCLGQSSLAQSPNSQTSEGYQSNEYDPLFGSGGGSFNPIDLIHRANLSPSRTQDQFSDDSTQQIKDAATEFRREQQKRLRLLQQQAQPVTNPPNQ